MKDKFLYFVVLLVVCLSQIPARAVVPHPENLIPKPCKQLVVINSYHENVSWVQMYITPFMMEAARRANLHCQITNMTSSLITSEQAYKRVEDGIFKRFEDDKPDYVVMVGSMAFALRDRIKKEWGDIPIILFASSDELFTPEHLYYHECQNQEIFKYRSLKEVRDDYNFTFIEIPNLYRETIDMMHCMQPWMHKIYFVSDALFNNLRLDSQIQEYITTKYHGIEYEWLQASDSNRDVLQALLVTNDPTVGVLLSSMFYIRQSEFGYPMLVTDEMRMMASSVRPVFTLKEDDLQYGALGGVFPNDEAVLKHSMDIFYKMLAGESMHKIPFVYSKDKVMKVDCRQVAESGLSLDDCPEGALFLNKPDNLWDTYSRPIITGVLILFVVIVIMVVFIMQQKRRISLLEVQEHMVNNMPICYMLAKIKNNGESVTGIEFVKTNNEADILVAKNAADGKSDNLFDAKQLMQYVDVLRQTERKVTFTCHFEKTETYYEFIMCPTLRADGLELFGINITEKVNSESMVKETLKKLEMTLDIAHIIPWRWDVGKHLITYDNQTLSKFLSHIDDNEDGIAESDTIHENDFMNMIHKDDIERVKRMFDDLCHGKVDLLKDEFRVMSERDGKEQTDWLEINASVGQFDAQGRPELIIGSLLLITERKKQEARLISAREAAKEADRLKSAFLANMSHEIRTPLNAIVGFSNLLAVTDDKDERREFINIIESNNEQLLSLIGDIIDMAKVESGTLDFIYKPVDVNELMLGLKRTIQMRVKEGVVLNCTLGAVECRTETDPARLAQVLTNFLTNACKFTGKGNITFGYEINDDELHFFVSDTGCGIPADDRERVFQRFVRLDTFVPGTGLGLPICKNIVEKLGGKIGVESKGIGMGSTFWFTIPYKPV